MVDSGSVSNGVSRCFGREPGAALEAATGRGQKQEEECPGAFAWSGQQGAAEDCPLLLTALGERPGWSLSQQRLNQGSERDKEAGKGHYLRTRNYGLQTSWPPLRSPLFWGQGSPFICGPAAGLMPECVPGPCLALPNAPCGQASAPDAPGHL